MQRTGPYRNEFGCYLIRTSRYSLKVLKFSNGRKVDLSATGPRLTTISLLQRKQRMLIAPHTKLEVTSP